MKGIKQLAGNATGLVQAGQSETVFMRRDLEHTVGRGVADRLSAAAMLLTQSCDDLGARGMAVPQDAGQIRSRAQTGDQRGWKGGLGIGEIMPVGQRRRASDFPMTGRCILAGCYFRRGGVAALARA